MAERFTPKQRAAILARDDNHSQVPHYSEKRGWFTGCDDCPFKEHQPKPLDVHHITTNRLSDDGGNDPNNLITANRCEHRGVRCDGSLVEHGEAFVIHPDVVDAMKSYRAGNKKAFDEMKAKREVQVAHGEIYWDNSHDNAMRQIAEERTANAVAKGWTWPERKRRG